MKRLSFWLIVMAVVLQVSGCGMGIIYTHTVHLLTLDMDRTPLVPTSNEGDIKHIQLRGIGVAWDSTAIGDIARKHGMNELYFADLETLSVLSIWHQHTLHVYGK
jgi:hypothetical protein